MLIDPKRIEWLKARKTGVGGSEVAAILGLSNYATPYTVWLDKTNRSVPDDMSEAAYWGIELEDIIAREFSKRSGLKIQKVNLMMRHETYTYAIANIDRAIVNPAISGTVRFKDGALTTDQIYEGKTSSAYFDKMWGDELSDAIPEYYLCQVMWYLGITGTQKCHLAVLIGGQKYKQFLIERDEELIAMLFAEAGIFWRDFVLADIPPDPINLGDCALRWSKSMGGVIEADEAMAQKLAEYKELKALMKTAKSDLDDLKFEIVSTMQEAETLMIAGKKACTYKHQTTRRINPDAFRTAYPDLAEKFTETTTNRVLRLS